MFRIVKFLKGYYKESIIAPLFKMLEASFELIIPLITAHIIDVGIKNNDTALILKMGGVLVGLGVLGLICSLIAQYFAAKAAMGFGKALRSALFSHISSFSYAQIDKIGTPTLINRIVTDATQAQTGVNMTLRLFLRSPFIVVGAVFMAMTIDLKLTLIFLICVPLIAGAIYLIMRFTTPGYKKIQGKVDRVSKSMRENLSGVRVIRAFSQQKRESREFSETNDELSGMQQSVGLISALLNPITYVIVNLAIVAIMYFGGGFVYSGVISQGDITALINYMTQILIALIALGNFIVILTKALASCSRVLDILDTPAIITDGEGAVPSGDISIEFKNVFFRYSDEGDCALSDITFSAKKGETIGIIGGTGSGKSTLIHLIPRFYDVSDGEILFGNKNVKEFKLRDLREKIGVVPQKAVLFRGNIRENMLWGNKNATDDEIFNALEIAQASDFVREKGLDFLIEEGGKNLSGGQKQRLTIARALIKKPDILILDDSASALDFATDSKLRRALSEKTDGMTVFIVSQRANAVKNSDKILVLDDGEIVGCAKHAELFDSCEIYREICESQGVEK